MTYLFHLALRNIGRNRRRSILAVVSMTLAVLFIVLMQGLTGGFLDSLVKNYTKNETGHIRITTRGFDEKSEFFPVTDNINSPDRITKTLLENSDIAPLISCVAPRFTFGVLLSNGSRNRNALVFAGDPAVEKELLNFQKSIEPGGRYLESNDEALIGVDLAKSLGYTLGDTVRVMTRGADYALHLKKFRIVGILNTGINSLDDAAFQISLEGAQELLRAGTNVQQLLIMLKDYHDADRVAKDIDNVLGNDNLRVVSWTGIGDYYRMVRMASGIYDFIYAIVVLLGAFIISNIMMMVVMERRHEIGILKSMGMTRGDIMLLFLCEGALLGLAGSLCGSVLGMCGNVLFHFNGIDFSAMLETVNFPMDNVIRFDIDPSILLKSLILGTVISALVSIVPSRRAATIPPVDAIKSV